MGRRLIIGDLHGSYKALVQCLEKAGFDKDEDILYSVGDIADGYPDVYECLSFLKGLPSFHPVMGNHDVWLQNWLASGSAPRIWTAQGGNRSIASFERNNVSRDERRDIASWMRTWPYVIILDDAIIMHGGPGTRSSIPDDVSRSCGCLTDHDIQRLASKRRFLTEPAPGDYLGFKMSTAATALWDRSYFRTMMDEYVDRLHAGVIDCTMPSRQEAEDEMRNMPLTRHGKPLYKKPGHWSETKWMFTGHTEFGWTDRPFIARYHPFINLDTEAGSYGRLTLMDMDTFEYWQSDPSSELYPGYGPEYW